MSQAGSIDWLAVIAALQRAVDDVRTNRAPPAPLKTADLADSLESLSASLPGVVAVLRAHQGVETGLADLLAVLAAQGVPHAAEIRNALLSFPGALETAEKYLPIAAGFLSEFKAAPTGIRGGFSGAPGHI